MTDALRRATIEDIPAMAAVVNDWIDATPWMARTHAPDVIAGFLRDAFAHREMWVHGDPVDGYMSFDPESRKVGALYCAATGQGTGKALLDKAKQGRDHIWLTTHVPNVAAQRFYHREGFVKKETIPAQPPETVDELKMEWRR